MFVTFTEYYILPKIVKHILLLFNKSHPSLHRLNRPPDNRLVYPGNKSSMYGDCADLLKNSRLKAFC